MQTASTRALRTLLADAGYEVIPRTNVWAECLVRRGPERWVGRGADPEEALSDAVAQLLPSHLGRMLLDLRLAAFLAAEAIAAMPAVEAAFIAPAMVAPPPQLPAEAVPAPVEAPAPQAPLPLVAEAAPVVPAAEAASAPVPVEATLIARPKVAEALETVEGILAAIEGRLPALARMCAERQRFNMLVWICRARSIEESLPGVRDVEQAVARVARRLTDIGKMFWPGSVRALQLSARPQDVRREMHASWASEPGNWVEASALAGRLLDEHLTKSNDAGLDPDGWADVNARNPPPPDPDAMFEELDAELKTLLVPPGEVPNGRLGELTATEIDALISAARRLRWVRAQVKNDLDWGVAMGRLRRALPGLGDRAARIKEILDARYRPSVPWQRLVGEGDAPESVITESPARLTADLPAALENKDALLAWLIRAFDVLNTPVLVEMLAPKKELVTSFTEEEQNHPDRRVRRRLRELVKRMAEAETAPAKEAPKPARSADEDKDTTAADDTLAQAEIDILSARVRAQTQGRRALFVSNREDPELGARLTELLGISVAWCDGSLRRVQAQCERIQRGSYDLVLSATGFQVHGVDSALARASSGAGIPYVRVNRGRPVACVQAIAREFGLSTTATLSTFVRKAGTG
jgi:hypothetical protein